MTSCIYSLLALLSFFFVVSAGAEAPPRPAQSNVLQGGLKKEVLSFEDELVEGGVQKPELFYLFQKKNFNYKRLIRLRENFLPEMRNSAEGVQRNRGAQ